MSPWKPTDNTVGYSKPHPDHCCCYECRMQRTVERVREHLTIQELRQNVSTIATNSTGDDNQIGGDAGDD